MSRCDTREPVPGERVVHKDGQRVCTGILLSNGTDPTWTLDAGEEATVDVMRGSGSFTLLNKSGVLSDLQNTSDYNFTCKSGPSMEEMINMGLQYNDLVQVGFFRHFLKIGQPVPHNRDMPKQYLHRGPIPKFCSVFSVLHPWRSHDHPDPDGKCGGWRYCWRIGQKSTMDNTDDHPWVIHGIPGDMDAFLGVIRGHNVWMVIWAL